jgi:hypothetical protein
LFVICNFRSRDFHRSTKSGETTSDSNSSKDRSQIHRILHEVGLNPTDYILSPSPENNASEETSSIYRSAFSSYSPQLQLPDKKTVLNPQTKSLISSARSISYVQQPQIPPPPPQLIKSQPPASNSAQVPPPPTLATQSGPPPPVSISSPLPTDRSTFDKQNVAFQSMDHHALSPRRSPPPLPPTFTSNLHESTLSAEHYLRQINSHENPPVKVVKPSTQNVVYRKEIRIRYLQPPTPPPPAPIIIREKHEAPVPPQSVRA